MTSLVDGLAGGARRLVGRGGSPVGERLRALETAAQVARGRLDEGLVDRAEGVVRRGEGRLALSGDHTVVALAGATGSGKSSTFNALSGVPIAAVSVPAANSPPPNPIRAVPIRNSSTEPRGAAKITAAKAKMPATAPKPAIL